MTPSLRALAALAIAAPLCFAACAEAPPAEAPPQPAAEPPPSLFGPAGKGVNPVDEQMLALARAEDEIDKLFPDAGKAKGYGRKKPADKAPEKPLEPKKDADQQSGSTADACVVACRALGSMRTSADHLCKLAGEGDGRCEDARGRVRGATARVRSVCPECSVGAN